MYQVFVTAKSFDSSSDGGKALLEKHGCRVVRLPIPGEQLRDALEREIIGVDAIIAGLESYDSLLLQRAKRLKVISRYGVGYDNIDITAAGTQGIAVTNTPGANSESVADLAIALMLSAARHVPYMDRCMKERHHERPTGTEMWGKTLGIIGAGRIGQGVARRCRGFQMKILCYDKYEDSRFSVETGAQYVSFDELIRKSDFISVHSPLNAETLNMINAREFSAMKPGAILINTARGGIINEQALYEALKSGKLSAAGLDATEVEPPVDSPLLSLPNCILTPHAGAATFEASANMSLMAARNALDILYGRSCPNQIK